MNKINDQIIQYDLIEYCDIDKLKQNLVIPLNKQELFVQIALYDKNIDISWMQNIFNMPIKIVIFSKEDIEFILNDIEYRVDIYKLVQNLFLQERFNNIDVNSFFDKLIEFAILKKSSDIHIETISDGLVIRFRIDGKLIQILKFGFGLYPIVSAIIKIVSNLDISMKRLPQNGRFSRKIGKDNYDFRVSIMPIMNGESIVIRILNQNHKILNLNNIGLEDKQILDIKESIFQTQGLILVTGPTGSGKTTTLYSILNEINDGYKKIVTLEEPVEYKISGISQININDEIGLGYERVLKDILRQDPDIIMIGEIRDSKTLHIALQAALTGHLVLATLHTNDAISTIDRLLELDAIPYLVASTLNMIISQRLLRRLCENCKVKKGEYYIPKGCSRCNLSGYDSRFMVCEILKNDNFIRENIRINYNSNSIYKYLINNSFKTMYDNGMYKVKLGYTSYDELNNNCKKYETV